MLSLSLPYVDSFCSHRSLVPCRTMAGATRFYKEYRGFTPESSATPANTRKCVPLSADSILYAISSFSRRGVIEEKKL